MLRDAVSITEIYLPSVLVAARPSRAMAIPAGLPKTGNRATTRFDLGSSTADLISGLICDEGFGPACRRTPKKIGGANAGKPSARPRAFYLVAL